MMRQGYDRVIVQTQGYMKDTLSRTCFMAGLMVCFMAGGLALSAGNASAATVFLVCDGNFKTITGVSDPHSRSKGAHASFLVKLPCRVEPEKTRIEGVSVMFVSIPQNDFIGIKSNRRRLIRR